MVNEQDISIEERLERAKKPGKDAMVMHKFYGGKVETVPKACVRSFDDFAIWYSPGVAEPCKDIAANPDMVYEHTCKWNTVAVVSDGTRVLGLGDIGPEAAMPVMEGKAMLFKYLGGVDCVPICLDTKDPDKIIETVRLIAPSFGGINLEDISNPKCFDILDELRRDCKIPVWHDDQQGTATVEVAGAINAMKLVGKKLEEAQIAVIGAGAASIAIARLLLATGFKPEHMCMCDSKGILNLSREDVKNDFKQKWDICQKTNGAGKSGGIKEAMEGADIVIAASKPGPGTIPAEYVKLMADDPVVFATANPIPEMWPWEAKEYGCKVFATGRSDFPNQVNNSMGFPAIFRGVLDVRAKTITDEMCIRAQGLVHPLIQKPVPNDICWTGSVLVTGSNASGKSTWIKALAVNAILAQTVGTCMAASFALPRARVMTSMALRDSLMGGESYFVVEVRSLRRLLEAVQSGARVICMIDEILRGTNTVERIAASSTLLEALDRENCLCMAATHDQELTRLLGRFRQIHFSETIVEGGMVFSYKLLEGPSDTRNALLLMRQMGFPQEMTRQAERRAQTFDETGQWA